MELIEKLKKQLSEEYGIHSDQELIQLRLLWMGKNT